MIKYRRDKKIMPLTEIRNKYTTAKALVVLNDISDMENLVGYVYAESTDASTLGELCKIGEDIRKKNKYYIIVGEYKKGAIVSVQYETKQ